MRLKYYANIDDKSEGEAGHRLRCDNRGDPISNIQPCAVKSSLISQVYFISGQVMAILSITLPTTSKVHVVK